MALSNKVKERLVNGLKRFQPVVAAAKTRDVNESDTVTIVTDILAEVFGFDKYSEITSEYVIRGTYVDLALKLDGKLQTLIEVKAIGLELKDSYTKQAVDYGANQGIEWVILTNAVKWQIYKVTFGKPIGQELVLSIDFMALNYKNASDLENLHLLTKEGLGKSILGDYHAQRQALSRFFIGATVLSDPVLDVIRRELRRISPDVKIDTEQIREALEQEVFKRDVLEGEKAEEARRKIARIQAKPARKASKESPDGADDKQAEPIVQAVPTPSGAEPAAG